jgi:hypothetical protein
MFQNLTSINIKKFWEELIPLLKLTVNNLVAIWNINNPNTLLSKVHLTNLNLIHFKIVETMGTKITASKSP